MDDMARNRIASGSEILDRLLEGGYERDVITTIYGPAGSGKTLLCMLAALNEIKQGRKVVYVDTEGGFSVERLKQLTPNAAQVLDKMVFLKPTTFEDQRKAFERLKSAITDRTGLVVVDTIAMLYRIEIGKRDDVYETNKDLGIQLSYLNEIVRKKKIPVLITNQVYADFENPQSVKMVGGDILKYTSKCLLELLKLHGSRRKVVMRKHRSIPDGKFELFDIVEKGIQEPEKGAVL